MLSFVFDRGFFGCIVVNVVLLKVWKIGNVINVIILLLEGFFKFDKNVLMVIFFLVE